MGRATHGGVAVTTMLPVDLIDPDPENVRAGVGDPATLAELAESIQRNGLIQAVTVYPTSGRYRIQAGHRRFAAVQLLGLVEVDVRVVEPPRDNLRRLDAMLAENFHRESLNPMEEARAFAQYRDAGLGQEDIGRRVGRPQGHVSTTLMFLTELSDHEQQMLEAGQLTRTAAVATVKRRRAEQGRARSDSGGKHRYGYAVPWFNGRHPRAGEAQRRCRAAGHDPSHRLGPACGACWEITVGAGGSSMARSAVRDDRSDLVERARDLDELHALAGGVRETVMTATPERVRRMLDRAFARLMANVTEQQLEDQGERRTFTEAVADLTEVFEDTGDAA